MLVDINSVKINNVYMAQYITECKFGYHKIWGKDTGRNLAASNRGTLLGICPKLTCKFRKLTQAELETLAPIFDSSNQTTIYDDANKKAKTTLSTYTGDWEVINKKLFTQGGKNEGISIAFISNDPR